MNIDFANLQLQYQKYKADIDTNIQAVLNKSNYIMGEEVYELERALEGFTGFKYVINCSLSWPNKLKDNFYDYKF
jgi:UDP-2-acetamido-2-deoxy-ribo-hexuluronate aminotransferase